MSERGKEPVPLGYNQAATIAAAVRNNYIRTVVCEGGDWPDTIDDTTGVDGEHYGINRSEVQGNDEGFTTDVDVVLRHAAIMGHAVGYNEGVTAARREFTHAIQELLPALGSTGMNLFKLEDLGLLKGDGSNHD